MTKAVLVAKTCLDLNKYHQIIKTALGKDVDLSNLKKNERLILDVFGDDYTNTQQLSYSFAAVLDKDTYIEMLESGLLTAIRSEPIRNIYLLCIFTATRQNWNTYINKYQSSENDTILDLIDSIKETLKNA